MIAIRIDALGTASNLIADVLIGAAVALVVRWLVVLRARKQFERKLFDDRQRALDQLNKFLMYNQELLAWAELSVQVEPDPDSPRWHWSLDKPYWHGVWHLMSDPLQTLSTEYGGTGLSRALAPLRRGYDAAKQQCDLIGGKVEAISKLESSTFLYWEVGLSAEDAAERTRLADEANRDLAELRRLVPSVIADVEQLIKLTENNYDPRAFSERRYPDPFPGWLRNLAWCVSGISALFFLAVLTFHSHLQKDLAAGTVDNVLSAAVAALVGAALAVLSQSHAQNSVRDAVKIPYAQLTIALRALIFGYDNPEVDYKKLLKEVSEIVDDTINQLQHVLPDARLAQYAEELLKQINKILNDPTYKPYRILDAETKAKYAAGINPPMPDTEKLIDLSSKMSFRAFEIYNYGSLD